MDSPMEPLQRLPQQALISPTGARLVLCNDDAGYPDSTCPSSPGRGRWLASIDTKAFLQFGNYHHSDLPEQFPTWRWPAVVLMPKEYEVRVGGMSISELRSQLEKFWGQGGIPGAVEGGYQDMWVPAWAPDGTNDPYQLSWYSSSAARLDPAIFSCWVNRECAKWLNYFIANNHTFGVVHAWFAAFTGVTRESLVEIAEFFTDTAQVQNPRRSSSQTSNDKRKKTGKKKRRRKEDQEDGASMAATSHLKFRMSFDVCTEGYDAAVDGIPSLPLDTKTTTNKQGVRVIKTSINNMFPRRIWDICANTVIPATWFCGPRCPLTRKTLVAPLGVKPVLHAKVADEDLTFTMTEANQKLWPIRLPRGVLLEDVRQEMIRLGVRYAWLDILCLRQQGHPALAKGLAPPVSEEIMEKLQQRRLEEWKVDVPLIGAIYTNPDTDSLYGGGPTVIFMSGLGRPSRVEECASEQQWLRAWELQETPVLSRSLIAGLPEEHDLQLNSEVDDGDLLPKKYADLNALLCAMHGSCSINKVCAIALPFQKYESHSHGNVTLPIYDPSTPISEAWGKLISSIASTKMEVGDLQLIMQGYATLRYNDLRQLSQSPTIQLLRLFPHPSRHHWFPSWTQVQQYPDVSVMDDSDLDTGGIDYSLRIMSGRIYRGCSLHLTQSPTREKEAVYCSTMDGKDAELVATVPGIELHIEPGSKYVLVDISPDRSIWLSAYHESERCKELTKGHEHLPIWQKSVVLVCTEVGTLPQPATDTTTQVTSAIMLRRVTTLEWDCRLDPESRAPSSGRWLPFEPSLVHIESVACASGMSNTCRAEDPLPVFCDPAVTKDLLGLSRGVWRKEFYKRFQVYEVYLV